MEPTMTVEIDEAIRRDPRLLRDVEAATAYLRSLPRRVGPPHIARWSRPDWAEECPTLELDDGEGLEPIRSAIAGNVLRDRDGRESAIRWAWLDLLEQRSETAHKRVEASLAELEAEEASGR